MRSQQIRPRTADKPMERPLPQKGADPVSLSPTLPDVYAADEIARVAGVRPRDVRALAEAGVIRPLPGGHYFSTAEAVLAVRTLTGGAAPAERPLFGRTEGLRREPGMPIALSGTLHAAMLALIAFVTSMGVATTQARVSENADRMHLVFLMSPGPGGGGGGGGLKQPAPPPPAERKGIEKMRSPVPPVRRHPAVEITAK